MTNGQKKQEILDILFVKEKKMKVRISTEGRSIVVDMEREKAETVFNLLGIYLLKSANEQLDKVMVPEDKKVEVKPIEIVRHEPKIVPGEKKNLHGYKGFMYIECPHCKTVKGFNSKEVRNTYICGECGNKFDFEEELKHLNIKCQCGSSFHYMTNMKENMFDINCINCGNPVAVSWNEKKKVYDVIGE